MKKPKEKDIGFFHDGMQIFLSYIERKSRENPDYDPHPVIKAFQLAVGMILEKNTRKPVMAVSGKEGDQPTCVILRKTKDGHFLIEKVIDMTTDQEIPYDLLIRMFRFQIKLDAEGETIKTDRLVEILNEIFKEFHFHALGDRWPEALEKFKRNLEEGKFKMVRDQKLIDDLTSVKIGTPWEEFPSSVRGLVAGSAGDFFDKRANSIILSTPPNVPNDQNKMMRILYQQYLGQGKEYFGMKDCLYCHGDADLKKSLISVWDYHVLFADRFPLSKGHLFITSKIHVRAMGDLPLIEIYELEELIDSVSRYYKGAGYSDFTFIEAGFHYQSVYHAHVHLLPFYLSVVKDLPEIVENVVQIKDWTEVISFYKKNGQYIVWGNKDGIFIGKSKYESGKDPMVGLSEKIAKKMGLSTWKEKDTDKELRKDSALVQRETHEEWEAFWDRRKKDL